MNWTSRTAKRKRQAKCFSVRFMISKISKTLVMTKQLKVPIINLKKIWVASLKDLLIRHPALIRAILFLTTRRLALLPNPWFLPAWARSIIKMINIRLNLGIGKIHLIHKRPSLHSRQKYICNKMLYLKKMNLK